MEALVVVFLLLIAAFLLLALICLMINSGRLSEQERQEDIRQLIVEGG